MAEPAPFSEKELPDRPFYDADSVRHGMAELGEKWKNRLRREAVNFVKEYDRGSLYFIIKFDFGSSWDLPSIGDEALLSADKCAIHKRSSGASVSRNNSDIGYRDRPDNGRYDNVFIRIVEQVKGIERVPHPSREGFCGFEDVFNGLAGCYYSLTTGFKVDPTISHGEFGVAVLGASVVPYEIPSEVVQGGPKVVDSVAHYEGGRVRDILSEKDPEMLAPGFWVRHDANCIGVQFYEGLGLRFKIADVMFGPFDL